MSQVDTRFGGQITDDEGHDCLLFDLIIDGEVHEQSLRVHPGKPGVDGEFHVHPDLEDWVEAHPEDLHAVGTLIVDTPEFEAWTRRQRGSRRRTRRWGRER